MAYQPLTMPLSNIPLIYLSLMKMMNMCKEDATLYSHYTRGDVSLNYLWDRYPFIAHELTRQNMLDDVKLMFKHFI